jgi:hypothetical protein
MQYRSGSTNPPDDSHDGLVQARGTLFCSIPVGCSGTCHPGPHLSDSGAGEIDSRAATPRASDCAALAVIRQEDEAGATPRNDLPAHAFVVRPHMPPTEEPTQS